MTFDQAGHIYLVAEKKFTGCPQMEISIVFIVYTFLGQSAP